MQQRCGRLDRVMPFRLLRTDVQQGHTRFLDARDVGGNDGAHHGKLKQVFR